MLDDGLIVVDVLEGSEVFVVGVIGFDVSNDDGVEVDVFVDVLDDIGM